MNESISVKFVPTSLPSHSVGAPYSILINTVAQRSSLIQQTTPTESSRTPADDDLHPEISHVFAYSFITLGALALVAAVALLV
jgi:hypothetical protein